jgi:hypothetical protein
MVGTAYVSPFLPLDTSRRRSRSERNDHAGRRDGGCVGKRWSDRATTAPLPLLDATPFLPLSGHRHELHG